MTGQKFFSLLQSVCLCVCCRVNSNKQINKTLVISILEQVGKSSENQIQTQKLNVKAFANSLVAENIVAQFDKIFQVWEFRSKNVILR